MDFVPFVNAASSSNQAVIKQIGNEVTPWILAGDASSSSEAERPLQRLHNEILNFCKHQTVTKEDMDLREHARKDIEAIAKSIFPNCQVRIFGSQMSNLLTPASDLDIAILNISEDIDDPMELFANAIKARNIVSYLEIIRNAKVPIVKLDHIVGVSVDILFNNSSGLSTATLMKRLAREFPPLRPLTIVLKTFLVQRKLNDTYTGGIGSFVLTCLIVSFLQMRCKVSSTLPTPLNWNLGSLLIDFFGLYGTTFNFNEIGISIRNNGFYFLKETKGIEFYNPSRPLLLSIENPEDPSIDMGKNSFNFPKVKRAFEHAYQVLVSALQSNNKASLLSFIIRQDDAIGAVNAPRQRDE